MQNTDVIQKHRTENKGSRALKRHWLVSLRITLKWWIGGKCGWGRGWVFYLFLLESLHASCQRGKKKKKKVIALGFVSLCVAFCFCQLVTLKEKTGSQMVGKCMLNSGEFRWAGTGPDASPAGFRCENSEGESAQRALKERELSEQKLSSVAQFCTVLGSTETKGCSEPWYCELKRLVQWVSSGETFW